MKKVLFILIGISILTASVFVAYYFAIVLPEKENKKLEQQKEQTELFRKQFEYQKVKDAQTQKEQQLKETQDNWNMVRAECIAIADKNLKSFMEALNNCQTIECQINLSNNRDIQYFGEVFIESCIKKRL